MVARPIFDGAAILKAVLAGERHAAIAQRFGCARPGVSQLARKHGYDSLAACKSRRAHLQAEKIGISAPPPPLEPPHSVGRQATEVPAWATRAGLDSD